MKYVNPLTTCKHQLDYMLDDKILFFHREVMNDSDRLNYAVWERVRELFILASQELERE